MKYINEFKQITFPYEEPILDIGGGNRNILLRLDIEKADVVDKIFNWKSEGFNYIYLNISKELNEIQKKYKTIFMFEVLEHFKNPLYVMSKVYDLLEDDGVCYVAVPYTPLYPKREDLGNKYNRHYSRWTKRELVNQMDKLGFKVNVIQQKRRFKNLGFWLPYCWLVVKLEKEEELE